MIILLLLAGLGSIFVASTTLAYWMIRKYNATARAHRHTV
jgi:hypothetical protein